MAKTTNSSTPAQGGGSAENQNNLLSDLERSELTQARNEALKDAQSTEPNAPNYVAPKVEDPKQIDGALQESETPEWVQTILYSNQALIDSNNLVLSALDAFKENSADFVSQLVKEFAKPENSAAKEGKVSTEYIEADPDAKYEVAKGKEFRHPSDFNRKFKEGDDVTSLPTDRLTRLLNDGLIVES